MKTKVDREQKTITIGERAFQLAARGSDGWDIHEGDQHLGWFVIAASRARGPRLVMDDCTNYVTSRDGVTVTALIVGTLWLNAFAENESPFP